MPKVATVTNYTDLALANGYLYINDGLGNDILTPEQFAFSKTLALSDLKNGVILIPNVAGKSIVVEIIDLYITTTVTGPISLLVQYTDPKFTTFTNVISYAIAGLTNGIKLNTEVVSATYTETNMRTVLPVNTQVILKQDATFTAGAGYIQVYYKYV